MTDWFQLAAAITDPDAALIIIGALDPTPVDSNDTFPCLDEDFDQ